MLRVIGQGNDTHESRDFLHLRLPEAAGGDSGRAHSDAAGDKGRLRIGGNRILVDGDAHLVETMLHFLESRDVYVSSGSACSRGEASHTLTAMGLPKSRVDTALRVSFSGESTPEDVRALLDALAEGMRTLAKIRR